jgi:energy-coupling factor transporter ATP-binding protein EcfA2
VKRAHRAEEQVAIRAGETRGALVEVQHLTWRPFGRVEPILEALSLRIEPGQHLLLAGPSGSGKSTLLRVIAGVLITTESGELAGGVLVDGSDPQESAGVVGLMMQDPADASVASQVGRDVAFGLENASVPRERIWSRVREVLAEVRFPYGVEYPVNALSGGEAQRLALAGVLVLRPGLVLLDEPSSMLDPEAATTVREAIWAAARHSGATVVLVEHELEPWLAEIDRVVVLRADGAITADGTVATALLADSAVLAEQGLWVPGLASPSPLAVPAHLCAPLRADVCVGTAVVRANGVGVRRVVPSGLTGTAGGTVTTLSGVDAVVRAGEIVALVGVSGAGKSTLAALLAGLESPSSGTVMMLGPDCGVAEKDEGRTQEPWRFSPAELAARVGWVPQQAELAVVGRTVRDDALSTCRMLHRDDLTPRVDALLQVLGLSGCAEMDPHYLSGGQLRRLALVGAVAHGPSLLVLDEPTVGQDRQTWAAVAGVIIAARAAGAAVLVATHDRLLIDLADRCIRLDGGRVLGSDPPAQDAPTTVAALPERGGGFHTLAQRCGPLSLLGSAALLVIGSLFVTRLSQGLAGIAAELLLAPLVVGWRGHTVRRLLPGLLAVVSIAFSTWLLSTNQSLLVGATAGTRIAFFVLPGVLLVRFIDPFALGDHLGQRLRLPGRPVVAAVAALQRFDTLSEQWSELRRIRRVRGLDAGRGPAARVQQLASLTFALLVQTLRRAGRMAAAMEARGFSLPTARGVRRTWAEPAPWRRADTALMLLSAFVAAIPLTVAALS